MATPFELADIALPEGSEVSAFLLDHPDLQPLRFADEEFLVRQGDEADQATYLLLRGSCLVEYGIAEQQRQPGRELAILTAEPEQPLFVGEMSYLGTGIRCASVRSTMNTFAIRLTPAHMDQIIAKYPGLTRQLCRQFAQRLQESLRQLQHHREQQSLDARQLFLQSGETLAKAGTAADTLYQLIDGVLQSDTGDMIRAGAGSPPFIDLAPYLRVQPHPHTITCRTSCILIAISAASRLAVIRNFPDRVLEIL
jgi:CRP-like cAMP-binding protein